MILISWRSDFFDFHFVTWNWCHLEIMVDNFIEVHLCLLHDYVCISISDLQKVFLVHFEQNWINCFCTFNNFYTDSFSIEVLSYLNSNSVDWVICIIDCEMFLSDLRVLCFSNLVLDENWEVLRQCRILFLIWIVVRHKHLYSNPLYLCELNDVPHCIYKCLLLSCLRIFEDLSDFFWSDYIFFFNTHDECFINWHLRDEWCVSQNEISVNNFDRMHCFCNSNVIHLWHYLWCLSCLIYSLEVDSNLRFHKHFNNLILICFFFFDFTMWDDFIIFFEICYVCVEIFELS